MIPQSRPVCYHKAGPWHVALRRLTQRGYSDAQLALVLNELSDAAIAHLEQQGWDYRAVDAAREPCARLVRFTRWQVRYHRRRLELRRGPGHRGPGREWWRIADWRTLDRNLYAAHHGWGLLVNRGREIRQARERGKGIEHIACKVRWPPAVVSAWLVSPWESLRRREVDVLTALADHGPQRWPELSRRLGDPCRRTGNTTWLALLWHKALITRRLQNDCCRLQPGLPRVVPTTPNVLGFLGEL